VIRPALGSCRPETAALPVKAAVSVFRRSRLDIAVMTAPLDHATTRFAPSPNGPLHLGHAYAAVIAHDRAIDAGGRFLLRIEDIDGARSRSDLAEEFRADLTWLGLEFEEVPAQSTRIASYREAAANLRAMGLLYPCRCTRADVAAAATLQGPDGPIYPGTCLRNPPMNAADPVWRLDVEQASELAGPLEWHDERHGPLTRPALSSSAMSCCGAAMLQPAIILRPRLTMLRTASSVVTRGADLFRRRISIACFRSCSACPSRAGTTTGCWWGRTDASWPSGVMRLRSLIAAAPGRMATS